MCETLARIAGLECVFFLFVLSFVPFLFSLPSTSYLVVAVCPYIPPRCLLTSCHIE